MSYILDALKRADAERERGHVPSLHTHNLPPSTRNARHSAERPSRAPWWLAAAALALIAVVLIWWWLSDTGTAQLATDTPPAAAPSVTMAAPPNQPEEPSPTALAASEGPTLPILTPEPPKPPPRRPTPPSKVAVAKSDANVAAPVGAAVSTPSTTATPAQTSSGASTASIPHFGELSAEVRARLPALSVNGATYSKNPALRMLIVNGKVLQEGQEVAPGLKLEVIEPRSAVMNHQGTRYRVGY